MRFAIPGLMLSSVCGAGCVTQVVGVAPSEILNHLPELRRQGHAVLETTPRGTYKLNLDKVLYPEFPSRTLFGLVPGTETRAMATRELITNCPESPCLLLRTTSETLTVGTRRRPNWDVLKVLGGAVLVLAVLAVPIGFLVDHYQPSR